MSAARAKFTAQLGAVALIVAAVSGVALAAPAGATPSDSVVISEIYGGGGNSGATYANDFIELTNRGADAADLSGRTVQYKSAR
jgi:hypothetical protein